MHVLEVLDDDLGVELSPKHGNILFSEEHIPGVDRGSHLFKLSQAMAPRKRSRQDSAASSSAPAAPTSRIDETHAAQLARHLAGLRKLRRFTDLKV